MTDLGYTMIAEVKVLRRKHLVTFRVGMSAVDFIGVFKHVPPHATVDEVLECAEENPDIASIEFHEEVVEK